jgi:hypothetical protein
MVAVRYSSNSKVRPLSEVRDGEEMWKNSILDLAALELEISCTEDQQDNKSHKHLKD